jgi:hypothetical protein
MRREYNQFSSRMSMDYRLLALEAIEHQQVMNG